MNKTLIFSGLFFALCGLNAQASDISGEYLETRKKSAAAPHFLLRIGEFRDPSERHRFGCYIEPPRVRGVITMPFGVPSR